MEARQVLRVVEIDCFPGNQLNGKRRLEVPPQELEIVVIDHSENGKSDDSWFPLRAPHQLRRTLRWQRGLNFVASSALLVGLAPLMVVIAAIVKLSSKGPAIYRQRRIGQFGMPITIRKFRTMYHECEKFSGPKWCVPGDPRITRIGYWLRKTHLDELPQLWNVVRGEMSLVGPRPERPEIGPTLVENLPDYYERYIVLPGITGHAQIHLPPDQDVGDVRKKLQLDREYIQQMNCWFDLRTLVKTVFHALGWKKTSAATPEA